MYLVNKFGRVVELDDDEAKEKMDKLGFRIANDGEIAEMLARRQRMAETSAGENNIYFQTVRQTPDGYGMSRGHIMDELYKLGIILDESFKDQKIGLLYNYPYGLTSLRSPIKIIYTMFESDKIPEEWPELLKLAQEVIVPSKWCADTFKRSGVKTTIVPLGYNDEYFKFIPRQLPIETGRPYTFIHYDSFKIRKGFSEVFQAFNEEFGDKDNVQLILKTSAESPPIPIVRTQYPKIKVVTGNLHPRDLASLLGEADAMIYPSRGEGFGITPLEAMATGLPTVVPNAHGISEYFNPNYMLEVKVAEMIPAGYNKFKGVDVGKMTMCDVKDLKRQMRWLYNNQAKGQELGAAASQYVKNYTYAHTAKRLKEVLSKWMGRDDIKRGESKFLEVQRV